LYAGSSYQVAEVLDTPAHQTLIVLMTDTEVLIPFVDEYIADINHDKKVIKARNIDRLIDIYAN
jgi:16S rRNA processing protein RimM